MDVVELSGGKRNMLLLNLNYVVRRTSVLIDLVSLQHYRKVAILSHEFRNVASSYLIYTLAGR